MKFLTRLIILNKIYFKQVQKSLRNNYTPVFVLLIYYPKWVYKNIFKKGSINDRKPWLNFQAIKFLNKNITKGIKVFEYGSGGSTLFFLDKGCIVTSVEHDSIWYNKVSNIITSSNWEGILKKPTYINFDELAQKPKKVDHYDEDTELDPSLYISNMNGYWDMNFKDYASSIDYFPDAFFDLILIDGRSRSSCWKHSKNKLTKGGFLILDNSERKNYSGMKEEIRRLGWKEFYYYGPGPFELNFWETIIWKKC